MTRNDRRGRPARPFRGGGRPDGGAPGTASSSLEIPIGYSIAKPSDSIAAARPRKHRYIPRIRDDDPEEPGGDGRIFWCAVPPKATQCPPNRATRTDCTPESVISARYWKTVTRIGCGADARASPDSNGVRMTWAEWRAARKARGKPQPGRDENAGRPLPLRGRRGSHGLSARAPAVRLRADRRLSRVQGL